MAPPTCFSMGVGMWTSPGSITGGSGVTYWTRLGQLSRMMRNTSATFSSSTPQKTVVLPMRKKPPDEEVVVAEKPRRMSRSSRLRLSSLLMIAMTIFMDRFLRLFSAFDVDLTDLRLL